jgi:hypothetical protein
VRSPNKIDADLKNRYDNEIVLGIDHELAANFAVGGAITYRKTSGFQATPRLSAAVPHRFQLRHHPGECYTANAPCHREHRGRNVHRPDLLAPAALIAAGGNGRYRTNRMATQPSSRASSSPEQADVEQVARARGLLAERLDRALRRHARSAATATPVRAPTRQDIAGLEDGGQYSVLGGGSGKAAFYSSFKWQIYSNFIARTARLVRPLGPDLRPSGRYVPGQHHDGGWQRRHLARSFRATSTTSVMTTSGTSTSASRATPSWARSPSPRRSSCSTPSTTMWS